MRLRPFFSQRKHELVDSEAASGEPVAEKKVSVPLATHVRQERMMSKRTRAP